MESKQFCVVLFWMLVLPAVGQGVEQADASQAVPPWLDNINPADYVLIASDLSPPFVFQKDPGIIARANSTGMAVTTPTGIEQKQVSYLYAYEVIKRDIDSRYTHNLLLQVWVFENSELAVEFCKKEFNDYGFTDDYRGFTPAYNGLKDPRLDGAGASSWNGNIIQFKNMVAKIDESGNEETVYVKPLATLWIDKVSKTKLPELPDLYLMPARFLLSYHGNNNILPMEGAADQQEVAVGIENEGTVEARNVHFQLYLQPAGATDYQALGDPVKVGVIKPGNTTFASTIWDLKGQNVEGATLLAQAYIPGQNDSNEEDNSAAIKVNIYYAHNQDRAFNLAEDTYGFENYNFTGRETEELIDGFLATMIGSLRPSQIDEMVKAVQIRKAVAASMAASTGAGGGLKAEQALLERIIFAPTYVMLNDYLNRSMKAANAGHCYGMSATSALYFEDPGQKPVQKSVQEMSKEEASTNIDVYVRAWLLPIYGLLLSDSYSPQLNKGPDKCHQALKDALSQERKPLIIEFSGKKNEKWLAHAILGYKLIEVEGRDPVVYVYDPNYPASVVKPPRPMSQIIFQESDTKWAFADFMNYNYNWKMQDQISAQSPHREMSLEAVNAFVPELKKIVRTTLSLLNSEKKIRLVGRCPADLLFTDNKGRRTGTLKGQEINEIPGAEVLASGEVEIYDLPSNGEYQVSISGTGSGKLGFDVLRSENATSLGLISFQDIPLQTGTKITAQIKANGEMKTLQSSGKTIELSLEGSLDLSGSGPMVSGNESEKKETAKTGNGPTSMDEVDRCIKDLQSQDSTIREAAAAAVGDLNDTRAVEPLIKVLQEDKDSDVRGAAAISLGRIKDIRALDPLLEALQDKDSLVRSSAANGLGWLDDQRAVDALIRALKDESYEVRGLAAMSLGFIKNPKAVDTLVAALKDTRSEVRANAAASLGIIGDGRAIDPLIKALNDQDESVRDAAASSLQKLGWKEGSEKSPMPLDQSSSKPKATSSVNGALTEVSSIFSSQKIDENKGKTLSPDSTRIAYYERVDAGYYYVVAGPDGRINETTYQDVRDFVFSPDSSHYAYKALAGDKWQAVVDGSAGKMYDEIYAIIFSQDGGHYAYSAKGGENEVVIVDGIEQGPYDSIRDNPIFSSDGQHVAYTIIKGTGSYVVLDGIEQEMKGSGLVFSPDGSRWAYSSVNAYTGDAVYVILDGKIIDRGNHGWINGLYFSPDGKRFAFDLATSESAYAKHKIVEFDGAEGNEYEFPGVGKAIFSPDGSRMAYTAYNGSNGNFLVLDGVEGRSYNELGDPIFSPESRHVAYRAVRNGRDLVVLDDIEGRDYNNVWGLTFSADGRLAYAAREWPRNEKDVHMIVVDGQEGRPYEKTGYGQGIRFGPVFGPDGRHMVYVANDAGKAEFLVVDENRRIDPWAMPEDSVIVFDSPEAFHYLAENGTGTYLVKVKIPNSQAEPGGCGWTGIWETSFGLMDLEQQGNAVSGIYTHDGGTVKGSAADKNLTGKWSEAPSRAEPDDAGDFILTMNEDCQNFTGNWRHGSEGDWSGEWTGRRA